MRNEAKQYMNQNRKTLEAALCTATLIALQLLLLTTSIFVLPVLASLASIAIAFDISQSQEPQSDRSSVNAGRPLNPDEVPEASSGESSYRDTSEGSPDPPLPPGLLIDNALL